MDYMQMIGGIFSCLTGDFVNGGTPVATEQK